MERSSSLNPIPRDIQLWNAGEGSPSSSRVESEESFQERDPSRAAQAEADADFRAAVIAGSGTAPVAVGKGKERESPEVSSEHEVIEVEGPGAEVEGAGADESESSSSSSSSSVAIANQPLPAPAPAPQDRALTRFGQTCMFGGGASLFVGSLAAGGSATVFLQGVSVGPIVGLALGAALLFCGAVACLVGCTRRVSLLDPHSR